MDSPVSTDLLRVGDLLLGPDFIIWIVISEPFLERFMGLPSVVVMVLSNVRIDNAGHIFTHRASRAYWRNHLWNII